MQLLLMAILMGLAMPVMGSHPAPASVVLHPRFTVEINAQVSETSKESLISDMTTAFNKLQDVKITADGTALWILYLNVAPIMDKTGLKGYAISTVIADQDSGLTLKALPVEDFKSPEVQQKIKDLAMKQVDIRDHLMLTCTADGLEKAYEQIVNYFNESYLTPVREEIDNYNYDRSGSMRR